MDYCITILSGHILFLAILPPDKVSGIHSVRRWVSSRQ